MIKVTDEFLVSTSKWATLMPPAIEGKAIFPEKIFFSNRINIL